MGGEGNSDYAPSNFESFSWPGESCAEKATVCEESANLPAGGRKGGTRRTRVGIRNCGAMRPWEGLILSADMNGN